MPTQPPPYDFTDHQPRREDLLIDFNSAQSIPVSYLLRSLATFL